MIDFRFSEKLFLFLMNSEKQITIVKANGEHVIYNRKKLIIALQNSGADVKQSRDIALKVEK